MRRTVIKSSRAFTLIELLVVIAIIGILVALLVPAVNAAREASRNIQCKSHLRQVSLAVASFESAKKVFPPARIVPHPDEPSTYCSNVQPTWLVRILPYIEEQAIFEKWDLHGDFRNHPADVRAASSPLFLCPTRRASGPLAAETQSYYTEPAPCGCSGYRLQIGGALGDIASVHGDVTPDVNLFRWGGYDSGIIASSRAECANGDYNPPTGWLDRITVARVRDGLSHTLLLGEKHIRRAELGRFPDDPPWADGNLLQGASRVGGDGFPIATGPDDSDPSGVVLFGSWHPETCNFARADGSVTSLNSALDTAVLGSLCNREDGYPKSE